MIMGDRIRLIRKHFGLNQTDFGGKIGYKQTAIGLWENNQRSVPDSAIMLICSEFKINEKWLRDGVGEMSVKQPSELLEQIRKDYKLNDLQFKFVMEFLEQPAEERDAIFSFLSRVFGYNAATLEREAFDDDPIERELDSYRKELEAEKVAQTSKASRGIGENAAG